MHNAIAGTSAEIGATAPRPRQGTSSADIDKFAALPVKQSTAQHADNEGASVQSFIPVSSHSQTNLVGMCCLMNIKYLQLMLHSVMLLFVYELFCMSLREHVENALHWIPFALALMLTLL